MSEKMIIVRVALPVPLYRQFDYLYSNTLSKQQVVGARVLVPFGKRKLVGIVSSLLNIQDTTIQMEKLKFVDQILDEKLMTKHQQEIANWIASYYLVPIGLVYELFLPVKLRKNNPLLPEGETHWYAKITNKNQSEILKRAKNQLALFNFIKKHQGVVSAQLNRNFKNWRPSMKALEEKGLVRKSDLVTFEEYQPLQSDQRFSLNEHQQKIVDQIKPTFSTHLIYGITGSGKTEVYLSIVEKMLTQPNSQALLLVPEIALTPQFVDRVRRRLDKSVAVIHSGLNDNQRHKAWWSAKNGKVDIVLGTRANAFTDFKNLKLIIVDEEHDASFKQQEGVKYHARDVAIIRAKHLDIPIVMGSATPSFESLQNVEVEKFDFSVLNKRATGQQLPDMHLIDTSDPNENAQNGLSKTLISQIDQRLKAKQQCILFINRRGFSPTLYCTECAWVAQCPRCDARLTAHIKQNTETILSVRCHHCGYQSKNHQQVINQCGSCHQHTVMPLGLGTQRSEEALQRFFPNAVISRIDRDAITSKKALEIELAKIRNQEVDIILGTQMLAKGHDFPNVTLVGVLDADQGLFAIDFRGPEKLYQQMLQISGRAGRHRKGDVYIQTRFPEHSFFEKLLAQDYAAFAKNEIANRRLLNYPPIGFISLLRAESTFAKQALEFLQWCRQQIQIPNDVFVSDAVPAPMEKRAGRYRAQLMMQSSTRPALHYYQRQLISVITSNQKHKSIRWSLDVDPLDMY